MVEPSKSRIRSSPGLASSRSRSAPPRRIARRSSQYHDLAVQIVKNAEGRTGYKVMAGGGMGRTPYIAHVMHEFVEREDILAYLEAVLRVYNQDSRRDNIHKQRIKILINTIGPEEMRKRVAREFDEIKRAGTLQLPQDELDRITAYFAPPKFEAGLSDEMPQAGQDFADWVKTNVQQASARAALGYAIATITLKTPGQVPAIAATARPRWTSSPTSMDEFSVGEVRGAPDAEPRSSAACPQKRPARRSFAKR